MRLIMVLVITAILAALTLPAVAATEAVIDDARWPVDEFVMTSVPPAGPVAETVCPDQVPNCDLEARHPDQATD